MNKIISTALLSSLLLVNTAVFADDDEDEKNPDDRTYSSFRLTQATADFDNLDKAFNLGYSLGFRFPDLEFLAVELNISSTIIPGENSGAGGSLVGGGGDGGGDDGGLLGGLLGGGGGDGGDGGGSSSGRNTRTNDELLINTLAIFARVESPRSLSERFFASARVGYAYVDSTIPEMVEDGRSDTAWGLGLGYRYGEDGRIELSFTQMHEDLQYLTLSMSY